MIAAHLLMPPRPLKFSNICLRSPDSSPRENSRTPGACTTTQPTTQPLTAPFGLRSTRQLTGIGAVLGLRVAAVRGAVAARDGPGLHKGARQKPASRRQAAGLPRTKSETGVCLCLQSRLPGRPADAVDAPTALILQAPSNSGPSTLSSCVWGGEDRATTRKPKRSGPGLGLTRDATVVACDRAAQVCGGGDACHVLAWGAVWPTPARPRLSARCGAWVTPKQRRLRESCSTKLVGIEQPGSQMTVRRARGTSNTTERRHVRAVFGVKRACCLACCPPPPRPPLRPCYPL